jgi:hypothetical protein
MCVNRLHFSWANYYSTTETSLITIGPPSVAEPHHFSAAPASVPVKNFDAAPSPTFYIAGQSF